MKQTRYRALVVYYRLPLPGDDCMLRLMAKANPKSIQELEAQKKAITGRCRCRGCRYPQGYSGQGQCAQVLRAAFAGARHPRTEAARQPRQDPRRRGHDSPVPDFGRLGCEVQGHARRVLFRLTRPAQELRCMGWGWPLRNRAATRNRIEPSMSKTACKRLSVVGLLVVLVGASAG